MGDPLNFWALNANSSKMVKVMDFKFVTRFQGQSGYDSVKIFKPPPPVGAGGGYMFSGRPSVPLSLRPSVRASVRP